MIHRVLTIAIFLLSFNVMADPPGPDGSGSGDGGPLPGGGAPIGGGWLILTALAGIYGTRKTFQITPENKNQ